jgi:hypothetical protein
MKNGRPSIAPSIAPHQLVRLDRRGWSPSEIRDSIEMLDDVGTRMLAVFGDPRCAVRLNGAWVIVAGGLVVRADALRCLYRASGSAVHGLGCPMAGLIADAIMLAATTGPLHQDRVEAMAGKLAPATIDGLESAEEARERVAEQVNVLLDRGLLHDRCTPSGRPEWVLSMRGEEWAASRVRPRWASVAA